ncbi:MAG: VOC family protein [Cecembia sp.]
MKLEHVAIWTEDLGKLKIYYETFFGAQSNELYVNPKTGFRSYFLSFETGTRLELMQRPDIPKNENDRRNKQHLGIIHLAFAVQSKEAVDKKAEELQKAGFEILRGPRTTGDGYYEFETLDPDGNRLEVIYSE